MNQWDVRGGGSGSGREWGDGRTGGGREVVITGIGASTPLGGTAEETWKCLLGGDRAVRWRPDGRGAAPVAADPAAGLTRPQARRYDRISALAVAVSREAWADAGLPAGHLPQERFAVLVGTALGAVGTALVGADTLAERGPRRMSPHQVTMMMASSPAAVVNLDLKAGAGVHAPATGAEAIAWGAGLIRSGRADAALAVGTEAALHDLVLASLPEGTALGEAAGAVLLEERGHAHARGARVYAELCAETTAAGAGAAERAAVELVAVLPEPPALWLAPSPDDRAALEAVCAAEAKRAGARAARAGQRAGRAPAGAAAAGTRERPAAHDPSDALVVPLDPSCGDLYGAGGAVGTVLGALALADGTGWDGRTVRALPGGDRPAACLSAAPDGTGAVALAFR